jgi:hypothetical protein
MIDAPECARGCGSRAPRWPSLHPSALRSKGTRAKRVRAPIGRSPVLNLVCAMLTTFSSCMGLGSPPKRTKSSAGVMTPDLRIDRNCEFFYQNDSYLAQPHANKTQNYRCGDVDGSGEPLAILPQRKCLKTKGGDRIFEMLTFYAPVLCLCSAIPWLAAPR